MPFSVSLISDQPSTPTQSANWARTTVCRTVPNGQIVNLRGDVCTSGAKLTTDGSGLASILDTFLRWEPQAPRSLTQLVYSVAGLCRLFRDEVGEALEEEKHTGGPFTSLAAGWRELLFPDADEDQFADGYAQTVTFALLLARVERIDFTGQPISEIARQLGKGRRAPRRSRASAVRPHNSASAAASDQHGVGHHRARTTVDPAVGTRPC